jgi:hypothetical protein
LPLNINAVRALEEWSWKACENMAAGAIANPWTMIASDPKRAFAQQPALNEAKHDRRAHPFRLPSMFCTIMEAPWASG